MFEDKNSLQNDFKALATQAPTVTYEGQAEEISNMSIKSLKTAPWWQWLVLAVILLSIAALVWWYFNKPSTKALLGDNPNSVTEQSTVVNSLTTEAIDPNLDTDNDGLTDSLETLVYFTDPVIADTDADGYLDGEEVNNGYNPLGSGKLGEQAVGITSDPAIVAQAQIVLDNFAESINEKDGQGFLELLSPNNNIYPQVQAEPDKFLAFFASYYQEQIVSFSVKSATQVDNQININVDILLANNFFENTSFVLEKINEAWKILE